ncbi:hypothetical protein, partial [Staphylococcus haemolyticus]|uniref:hypothetical protein n=1 Tax=Staphylococcus haemolyticus TaxID=1283 RepID=UPI0011AB070B
MNMERENKNRKELGGFEEIGEEEERRRVEGLMEKERISKKDLREYRNITELSQCYGEMSIIRKISGF